MTRLTANGAPDDYGDGTVRTFVVRTHGRGTWQISVDTAAPSMQPDNAPYN